MQAADIERLVLPVLTALHVDVLPLRRAARPPDGVLMQLSPRKKRQEQRRDVILVILVLPIEVTGFRYYKLQVSCYRFQDTGDCCSHRLDR